MLRYYFCLRFFLTFFYTFHAIRVESFSNALEFCRHLHMGVSIINLTGNISDSRLHEPSVDRQLFYRDLFGQFITSTNATAVPIFATSDLMSAHFLSVMVCVRELVAYLNNVDILYAIHDNCHKQQMMVMVPAAQPWGVNVVIWVSSMARVPLPMIPGMIWSIGRMTARLGVFIIVSLWNLTSILSNFRAIGKV